MSFSAAHRQTPQKDPRVVDLAGHHPPIDTLDGGLKDLRGVYQLSLSTNNISTIQNIPENLVILSLGRNSIKRLDGIQAAGSTLEQCVCVCMCVSHVSYINIFPTIHPTSKRRLWISYNAIDSLKGIENMHRLNVLYASNNMISSWEEIDRLAHLEQLRDVLFIGNPLHARYHQGGTKGGGNGAASPDGPAIYVKEMRKRLKHLKKLDGKLLDSTQDDDQDVKEEHQTPGCCK